MPSRPLVVSIALLAAAAAACGPRRVATTPGGRTTVVLLPDPDAGAPASVTVSNAAGTVELDSPRESVQVRASQAPPAPVTMTEADIQRTFGAVLSDLPPPPQRFLLYFRLESDDLTVESESAVPEILKAVKARPVPEVTIIGHTDTTGSAGNNYKLGLKRAMMVRALLLATGLDAALIETSSHGEAEPVVPTPNETHEPRNRRVEIVIK